MIPESRHLNDCYTQEPARRPIHTTRPFRTVSCCVGRGGNAIYNCRLKAGGGSERKRRGNCHDNAVAESFFQLLKRERSKRKIYATREDARRAVFEHIELFYNPRRRRGYANGMSLIDYEKLSLMTLGVA